MKISLSTGSLYFYPLQWVLGMAAGAGFDAIELAIGPEAILRGPATVRELAGIHNLRVSSVHPPLFSLPGWSTFDNTARIVGFAAQVGATVVVQHTPDVEDLESSDGLAWRRAMDEARRRGANSGVTLALENRGIFRNRQRQYALADPESLYQFAEEHDFPLTFDTAHAASWPWNILELYDLFRDRLVNLHLSDFKSLPAWLDRPRLYTYIKHHQLLGAGDLPLRQLVDRARSDGYADLVTLELSPVALQAWWPATIRSNLVSTVNFIRNGIVPSSMREQAASSVSSRAK
ncbi:MAG: sugar phosphate isomerase/epimerase family protein [Anaerolineae bacterium]